MKDHAQGVNLFLPLIAIAVGFAGCQGTSQRYTFPATWPKGLHSPSSSGTSVAMAGPAVWVEPLTHDLGEGNPPQKPAAGIPTNEVLTHLLVRKLQQAGVRVSERGAEYALVGTVPRLGYTERKGYPRKLFYTSQLAYQLIHRPTGAVVWKGNLSQDFEQTVLVNTMTKLPEDPDAPENVLLRKCVDPTWESIAADVGAFVKKSSRK